MHEQLQQTAIIAAIVFSILMIGNAKDLLLYCFDASHARVVGLSPKWL